MAATNITLRLRDPEIRRIDKLAEDMGFITDDGKPVRASVLRAALELLRADDSGPYREKLRAENLAIRALARLTEEYGTEAELVIARSADREGEGEVTIDGKVPAGLSAHWEVVSGVLAPILTFESEGVRLFNPTGFFEEGQPVRSRLGSVSPRTGRPPLVDPPKDRGR